MTATLLILRHAKTEAMSASGQDFDRALTTRGINNARAMGERMAQDFPRPDLVLVSPAMRAKQTAGLVLPAYDDGDGDPAPPAIYDPNLYGIDAAAIPALVQGHAGAQHATALIIGHNPSLHMLVEMMLPPQDARGVGAFPTCALAVIGFENAATIAEIRAGEGQLKALLRPKEIGLPS